MDRKPIGVIMTDTHLSKDTIEINKSIYKQAITLCLHNHVPLYHAGDVFTARAAQPLEVLKAFDDILAMLYDADMTMTVIPGNHDKTDLNSRTSYLNPFSFHPHLKLINQTYAEVHDYVQIWMIPYFKEDGEYMNYLNQVKFYNDGKKQILITHISVNGVKNNDGSVVENGIPKELFNQFDKVLVGHYHNQSQIGDKIFYIGSAYQANYGEDTRKGFTILYNDGSHEFIQSEFPLYVKYEVEVDNLDKFLKDWQNHPISNSTQNTRFVIKGDTSKLVTVKKEKLAELGIDVKFESNEINTNLVLSGEKFEAFNRSTILQAFDSYCMINNIEEKTQGLKYLDKLTNVSSR